MEWSNVLYEVADGVAVITVNRPQALNALNSRTLDELHDVFRCFEDDPDAGCAVLTGQGKAFVAGADIAEMAAMSPEEARRYALQGQSLFSRLEQLEKPVIAAVNGFALGGGCELSMACDIRLASEKAVFGQPEINLGLIPGFGGSQRLPRLIGSGMAREILYTGRNIKADEALRLGLVNSVHPADALLGEARNMAKLIASRSRLIMRYAKLAVNRGADMDLGKAMDVERDLFALCFSAADQREGCAAFLEKRPAVFTHK